MRRRAFAPRLWSVLLTVVGCAAFVSAGTWQLRRADEKRSQQEAFARGDGPAVAYGGPAGQQRYAHVELDGHYQPEQQILLDNMTHDGRVGYRVLTPLRTSLGTVLVDRGWLPAPARRDQWPDIAVSDALRTVRGRLDELPRAGIALGQSDGAGWPRRLSYPDLPTVRRVLGRSTDPYIVLLDGREPDGYLRDWRPGGLTPERHLGYAVQWFGLALAALVIFIVVNLKRRTTERS